MFGSMSLLLPAVLSTPAAALAVPPGQQPPPALLLQAVRPWVLQAPAASQPSQQQQGLARQRPWWQHQQQWQNVCFLGQSWPFEITSGI